jgi:hypothetical protein
MTIPGFFSIRNFVAKQLIKPDAEGIMKLPNKGNIDFGEMMIRENLFKRGIDVNSITSEKQLESILNTPLVEPKVVPKKSGEVIKVDFGGFPPEKKAGGGRTGLSYLLAEDTNERVPFKMGRRAFLKIMGGVGAGIGALKTGALKLFGKEGATVAKEVTQVPIKNIDGMPAWFKPLVNRVIREGDDVTKKFATKEREIVHTKKIDDVDEVTVYQDLDTGNVTVEYGHHLTDDTGKVIRASNDPEVIHLSYKASEEIPLKGGKSSTKTKEEFSAVESEPEITNWDGDIDMTGVNEVNKVEDLITDTSKLQKYATGEKLTIKELSESMKKQKYKNKLETDNTEAINYIEKKHGPFPDPSDSSGGKDSTIEVFDKYYKKASGGRVPLFKGKAVKGLPSLLNKKKKKKKKKTLDVEEHGSAMAEWARKNDPEGYAKIQKFVDDLNQKIELKRAKRQKGRKDHALGGLANMLGE